MSTAHITVRIPHRKSLNGNSCLVAGIKGKPLVEINCALLPSNPAGIRIGGHWYIRADRSEAFRLNEFWRDAVQ